MRQQFQASVVQIQRVQKSSLMATPRYKNCLPNSFKFLIVVSIKTRYSTIVDVRSLETVEYVTMASH